MKTNKISGLILISEGKITFDKITNDGIDITVRINQLLALRDIIQEQLLEHEREVQQSFRNLPKMASQYDLEDSINEILKEQNGD